ncbi:MAG: hypothetical protein HYV05_00935, partial [Deltaproteobacteria bacterium]|nr:hypothetical protein [Deltaproteobacteria bacterium]
MLKNLFFVGAALLSSGFFSPGPAQPAQSAGAEWEKIVEAARKEGKVVASIPPSAQVRKGLEEAFAKRFGIVIESVPARGSTVIRRIVEESKAGVRYFDVHVGGTESVVKGLLPENVLDSVEPWFVLPEVKDQKNWWGGHIWIDRGKRYIYGFSAYQTASLWYNSTLVKPEEVRSFDDLLDARW